MAAPYNPPVKGQDFILRLALTDAGLTNGLKAAPAIAAGDFKVSIDGGALANLATLPVVEPAGSVWVKVTLSVAEMTGDTIALQAIDQTAPKEWADWALCILTVA